MLKLPVGTVLGVLEYLDIFEYFDIPRLFSCQNKVGTKFLVLSTNDDIDEYEILELVGFGVTVSDGMKINKKKSVYVTKRKGGEGAVREVVELIVGSKEHNK